jgi:hypothetical protein
MTKTFNKCIYVITEAMISDNLSSSNPHYSLQNYHHHLHNKIPAPTVNNFVHMLIYWMQCNCKLIVRRKVGRQTGKRFFQLQGWKSNL